MPHTATETSTAGVMPANTDVPFSAQTTPLKLATFSSLVEAIDYAATGEAGMSFYNARGICEESISYNELRERAVKIAKHLLGLGLERGDRVAMIASLDTDFIASFYACQYAGLLAVPLPALTGLGGKEGYERQMSTILSHSEARVALGPKSLMTHLNNACATFSLDFKGTVEDLIQYSDTNENLSPFKAGELSHIQFSSGSTRSPSGILISQDAMMANARDISNVALKLGRERLMSWLPFYHDMGLIGCLIVPTTCQTTVDYLYTDGFARRPLQWLELISRNGATTTFSPTFGYEICARRFKETDAPNLDLSSLRIAGIGGEMVQPEKIQSFSETFAPYGFDSKAFIPCYGLAEATLAFSFSPLAQGVVTDSINKKALMKDHLAKSVESDDSHGLNSADIRTFASCGVPMKGYELEVRDEDGNPLKEREVGCVFIKGPSLMAGYYKDKEATDAILTADGWLDTGDMGYVADGLLYITGRSKDLIIINGRNIWPQDLEWQAEHHVNGLQSRDTAAFMIEDSEGTETAVILVQCRFSDAEQREALRKEVHAIIRRNTGVDCQVVLVPKRSLPLTTSGKLSRTKAKAAYLEGLFTQNEAA